MTQLRYRCSTCGRRFETPRTSAYCNRQCRHLRGMTDDVQRAAALLELHAAADVAAPWNRPLIRQRIQQMEVACG